MLTKVNDLYHNLIYENVEDPWIRTINNDKDFFKEYLAPLAQKYNVHIIKARMNTFRIMGMFEAVKDALNNFKVDEHYWNKDIFDKDFCVYSPIITFGEVIHVNNLGEGYTYGSVEQDSLYAFNSQWNIAYEGRWYDLTDLNKDNVYEIPVRAKCATPSDLIKMIENLMEIQQRNKETTYVILEFVLNCQNLANQVYDEESIFVPEQEVIEQPKLEEPTAKSELPEEFEKNPNTVFSKEAVVNTYDKKNQFKKTTKKIK